jgi:hypothetical protein
MKWDGSDTGFKVNFVESGGRVRPATPEDQPYLDWLAAALAQACDAGEGRFSGVWV